MSTVEAVQRRIRTARELQAIATTMKGFAGVRIRHGERAALATREYERVVERGLQVVLRAHPELLAAPESRVTGAHHTVVIAFGSEQGLCGAVNRRTVAAVEQIRARAAAEGMGAPRVVSVGRRLEHELELAGVAAGHASGLPGAPEAIPARVQHLLAAIDGWQREQPVDRITLVHPSTGATAGHTRELVLVPLDRERLRAIAATPWPTHVLPDFSMDWRALFRALTRELMAIALSRVFAETLVAVNASRFAAMQAAEQHIDEQLATLQHDFNRLRQEQITNELLDLVSGFEAQQLG